MEKPKRKRKTSLVDSLVDRDATSISNEMRCRLADLEAIVNNAMIGIIKVRNRTIVWCNQKLEQMLGYNPGELNGKPTRICYGNEDDWRAVGSAYEQMKDGGDFIEQRLLKRKDNSVFWCFMSGKALDTSEPMNSSIWLFEDVSWRKEAEDELKRAHLQAEQASSAKSMFLATMSHEIRTPMNAITGLSHLMLQMNLPERARDYTEKIHSAGASLIGIVNDILDYSKLEAGKLTLNMHHFDLYDVMRHVETVLQPHAQDKGLCLNFEISPLTPEILVGDSYRLQQVLTNLVSNALKFTRQGIINVSTTVVEKTPREITLCCSVGDTGIGLSQEQQNIIFQPFAQLGSLNSRPFSGTGLGLSICSRLINMMGGKIEVKSKLGEGTTFWFTIRLEYSTDSSSRTVGDTCSHSIESKTINLKGKLILVVEDDPINQKIIRHMIELTGATVAIASSGDSALKILDRQARYFDAILINLKIAALDGYKTTLKIRQDNRFSNIPIIATTTDALAKENNKLLDFCINDYITTPLNYQVLISSLKKWLLHTKTHQHTPPQMISDFNKNETHFKISTNNHNPLSPSASILDGDLTALYRISDLANSGDFPGALNLVQEISHIAEQASASEISAACGEIVLLLSPTAQNSEMLAGATRTLFEEICFYQWLRRERQS